MTSGTALACDNDGQCPEGRVCTDAGRCLPADSATLTLLVAEPFDSNALRATFEQRVAAGPTRSNFRITTDGNGTDLEVLGVEQADDPRVILLYTNDQIPGATYELRVFGLTGETGEEPPDAGLSTLFNGFVEPATARSLVLFAPAFVTQGEPFELTVLARNDEDLSAHVDMSAALQ